MTPVQREEGKSESSRIGRLLMLAYPRRIKHHLITGEWGEDWWWIEYAEALEASGKLGKPQQIRYRKSDGKCMLCEEGET
jgi:hypothetical protein